MIIKNLTFFTFLISLLLQVSCTSSDSGSRDYDIHPFTPAVDEFSRAIMDGDVETVKRFIEEGRDVNAPAWHGSFPIQIAASSSSRFEVVKLLLENGADPNAHAGKCFTPLLYAARSEKSIEIVKILLEYGADPTAEKRDKYSNGKTPLDRAKQNDNKEAIKLLEEATEKQKTLNVKKSDCH